MSGRSCRLCRPWCLKTNYHGVMIYFVPHMCVEFDRHFKKVELAIDPPLCKLEILGKKGVEYDRQVFYMVDLFFKSFTGSFKCIPIYVKL